MLLKQMFCKHEWERIWKLKRFDGTVMYFFYRCRKCQKEETFNLQRDFNYWVKRVNKGDTFID
ncbi:hypothetical protein J32TS6_19040 [Virgibacillus pantothenticus]|uniref:hypothetical protein n=1 Tax=Virgibacillus pantothenticus TaxID=1473 RepID=UPI001B14BE9E|nr:hypothetical protein [Virgibacillus pantothenticus]GIP63349.1 hypothetical protein J32TS6_19040 [Virgibacillus pantothenticus]